MPDKACSFYLIYCPANNLFDCPGLMLAQDNLKKDIVLAEEYDIIFDKFQNSFPVKERLDLFLEISLFDVLPVKKPFPV